MSLFPAYAGVPEEADKKAPLHSTSDTVHRTDWLSNSSFHSEDALSVHQLQKNGDGKKESKDLSIVEKHNVDTEARLKDGEKVDIEDRVSSHSPSKKKKKKKKKDEKKKDEKKKDDKRKDEKHRHKHKSHSREHERSRDHKMKSTDSLKEKEFAAGKVFIEEMYNLEPEHAFRIDKHRDSNNFTYSSIYKGHVAKYLRLSNHCLGLKDNQTIMWSKNSTHEKTKSKQSEKRYYSRDNRKRLRDEHSEVVDLSSVRDEIRDKKFEEELKRRLFLPFNAQQSIPGAYNPLGIYDKSTELWLQGKGLIPTQPTSNKTPTVREKNAEYVTRKTGEFNKILRENKQDVKTWLAFVKFQEEVVELDSTITNRSIREGAHFERKVAILERSIKENPACVELKLELLELCRKVWDSEKLEKEWKKLICVHSGNLQVWEHYLMFVACNRTGFSVLSLQREYSQCLAALGQHRYSGTVQGSQQRDNIESFMIDIFTQRCIILKQSGHFEKAIASFQAQVEFNLFCPGLVTRVSHAEKVALFEAFWDSCHPRFGENGAKGWSLWMEEKKTDTVEPMRVEDKEDVEDELLEGVSSKPEAWMKLEAAREYRHWLPWKPDPNNGETEEDCEDPERLVLVDDISTALFTVQSEDLKSKLVIHFLLLLGACRISDLNKTFHPKSLSQIILDNTCMVFDDDLPAEKVNSVEYELTLYNQFVTNVFRQTSVCFSDSKETRSMFVVLWMRYEIQKLGRFAGNAKSMKQQGKEVKKFAKTLLKEKENRNDLRIWNEYARFEWTMGNKQEARKVYDSAIMMNVKDVLAVKNLNDRCATLDLFDSYAKLELGIPLTDLPSTYPRQDCDRERALHVLCALTDAATYTPPGGQPNVSGVLILRARNLYQSHLDKLLDHFSAVAAKNTQFTSNSKEDEILVLANCFAMFQYLTDGVQSSSDVFQKVIYVLKKQDVVQGERSSSSQQYGTKCVLYRQLLASHIRLLAWHMEHNIAPLRQLRLPLQEALEDFPDDPRFLKLFVKLEQRSHIAGRLRKYFSKDSKFTNPMPWLYAVHAEFLRQQSLMNDPQVAVQGYGSPGLETGSGTVHYLRSVFERGSENRYARHCVLLWRWYLKFEILQGNKERAKLVIYRALSHCPWAKTLYTDAIGYFPEKLVELMDIMTEKELRVRAPIEELDILMETSE